MSSPSGYATDGGFPFQMQALSELFDRTTLVVPVYKCFAPAGTNPLVGHNLAVKSLDYPPGGGWRRKLTLLLWTPSNLPRIWREISRADAVHAPIGGDIGTIGILVALILRRPLFVRYCGVWGRCTTVAQHFWHWLLVRIAGGRNVVLATGGSPTAPSARNPAIEWVFSTSLRREELENLPFRHPWRVGEPLKLITVGRQEASKNTERIIRALVLIRHKYRHTTLDIVGDGSCLPALRQVATDLKLDEAVTFHGKLDHDGVLSALGRAHLFCFPTDSEGFPKAVHEALACGLPVITTKVSALPELVGNRSGILLNDAQPETIAQAVLRIVINRETLRQMSVSARQTSSKYTLERWRDFIGERLTASWGLLRQDGIEPPPLDCAS
jgi:glycosyltransferase involved in cell wall biosynthesis